MTNDSKKKIGLITIVVIILGLFMIIMNSSLEEYVEPVVESQSFREVIKAEVGEMIPDAGSLKNFKHKNQYLQINDEIITEQLLGKINDEESADCRKLAFDSYVKYVEDICLNILQDGNWNSSIMSQIKDNCQMMAASEFCSAADLGRLTSITEIANNYFSALGIIGRSKSYLELDVAKDLISKANTFRFNTKLQPCKSLMSKLDSVKFYLFDAQIEHLKGSMPSLSIPNANLALDQLRGAAQDFGQNRSVVDSRLAREIQSLNERARTKIKNDTKKIIESQNIDEDIF